MKKLPIFLKDDPLEFIFRFHQLIGQRKKSSILVFGSLSFAITVTMIGSYNLWKEDGNVFLKHHSTNFFLSPWIVISNERLPRKQNVEINLIDPYSIVCIYKFRRTVRTETFMCVKCDQQHDSKTCAKPKTTPARCALCDGDHPSNYKGCQVKLQVWATMVTEFFLIRPGLELLHRNEYWDIETASSTMRSKLQQMIKMKRIEFSLYLFQCLMVGSICPLIGQIYGRTVYVDINYIGNYYSGSALSKFTILGCLYLGHQLVTFYAMSSFMMMKYITQTVIIQLYILADFLNYADEYKNDHLLIRDHLKICCAHHVFIMRLIRIVQKVCYIPIIYMLFCGQLVLLGCSIFLFFLSQCFSIGLLAWIMLIFLQGGGTRAQKLLTYNHQPLDLLQIGSIMFLSYILAMDFCQSGQECGDAFEEFRLKLLKLKWYNWDSVNKNILLIILIRTQNDEKIRTLGLIVDRTLMVTILKLAYQTALIFRNMNSRG